MQLYNTDINVIGSIPNYDLIYQSFKLFSEGGSKLLNEIVVEKNQFDFRTEKSRKLIVGALLTSIHIFKNNDHKNLINSIFVHNLPLSTKQVFLFLQFAINNALFYDITNNVYLKIYNSERLFFSKDDVMAFIKEVIIPNNKPAIKWSDSTVDIIASKYLTFLKKTGFLEGKQKKKIKQIFFDDNTFVLFIYFIKACYPHIPNILSNPFVNFTFQNIDAFVERTKKVAVKEYFDMSFSGDMLNIEPKYNFNEITHVVFNRQ